MPAITLRRIDHARNMHRYYRLDVQPDLFGEWRRIGQPGRMRVEPYPTAAQAEERMRLQQAAKQGRGYTRIW